MERKGHTWRGEEEAVIKVACSQCCLPFSFFLSTRDFTFRVQIVSVPFTIASVSEAAAAAAEFLPKAEKKTGKVS